MFDIADLIKKMDKRISEVDDGSSSSGDDFIRPHRHPPVKAVQRSAGTLTADGESAPEVMPKKSFNSYAPFTVKTSRSISSAVHDMSTLRRVPASSVDQQDKGEVSLTRAILSSFLSKATPPTAGASYMISGENQPMPNNGLSLLNPVELDKCDTQENGDSDSSEDDEDEENSVASADKAPGTYVETVSALILDDVNDAIIGSVMLEVSEVA